MNDINEWKTINPAQNNINMFYDRKFNNQGKNMNYDVFVVITIYEHKDMDVQVFKSLDKAHEYQEGEATNEKGSYSVVYPLHYMDK